MAADLSQILAALPPQVVEAVTNGVVESLVEFGYLPQTDVSTGDQLQFAFMKGVRD